MASPKILAIDDRRECVVPGNYEQTIQFAVDQLIAIANRSIAEKGRFTVALSGGSTPKAIYQQLANQQNRSRLDWKRAFLFWGDERCVRKDHPDSNYLMAMQSGLDQLPIPREQLFPFPSEGDLQQAAEDYEQQIRLHVPEAAFDLMMLGMGEDGHTASLFPQTDALHVVGRLAVANFVPQKQCWRMTMTYDCINASHHPAIYVLGKGKAEMVKRVFADYDPLILPIQKVGTPVHKALWVLESGLWSGP